MGIWEVSPRYFLSGPTYACGQHGVFPRGRGMGVPTVKEGLHGIILDEKRITGLRGKKLSFFPLGVCLTFYVLALM